MRELGTEAADQFAASRGAEMSLHTSARLRYIDKDLLIHRFQVAESYETAAALPPGWRRMELLDEPTGLLAASPLTARWLSAHNGARSRGRLLVETHPNLPSGFQLPVGVLAGSFDLTVGFAVLNADKIDSAVQISLGPADLVPLEPQENPRDWLMIGIALSGGATDTRVGSYLHTMTVRQGQAQCLESSHQTSGWLPHRPYEVRVCADATTRVWKIAAYDLLSGAKVLEGRMDNVVWPDAHGSWALGMRGRPAKPGMRVVLNRVSIDTPQVQAAAGAVSATAAGWVAGGKLACGGFTADEMEFLLGELPGDARRLADVIYACFHEPALAERGLDLVQRFADAVADLLLATGAHSHSADSPKSCATCGLLPTGNMLKPEVAESLARIRDAAQRAFINRASAVARPAAASALRALGSRITGDSKEAVAQRLLVNEFANWIGGA